jgi:L-asparaginase II
VSLVSRLLTDLPLDSVEPVLALDVVVTRGALVESRHRVHAAVVDATGRLRYAARNPRLRTWWRSCAKPFQVMPLVASGDLERLPWGSDELALACASHGGEPEHVAIAAAMLGSVGLEAGDLACGAHEPLTARGQRLLRESGATPSRLHNNCSGKHAAMLARAALAGWPTAGYERPRHPVQQEALASVAAWAGMAPEEVGVAVDGCGVAVFALTLEQMALAYARLAAAARDGDPVAAPVVDAMTRHPFLVGGSGRFDTALMEACNGRVLAKIGAEGVHSLALLDQAVGIAVKVEDGAPRAQYPAVLAVLELLGALPDPVPEALREFLLQPVPNTRGEIVGEVRLGNVDVGDLA